MSIARATDSASRTSQPDADRTRQPCGHHARPLRRAAGQRDRRCRRGQRGGHGEAQPARPAGHQHLHRDTLPSPGVTLLLGGAAEKTRRTGHGDATKVRASAPHRPPPRPPRQRRIARRIGAAALAASALCLVGAQQAAADGASTVRRPGPTSSRCSRTAATWRARSAAPHPSTPPTATAGTGWCSTPPGWTASHRARSASACSPPAPPATATLEAESYVRAERLPRRHSDQPGDHRPAVLPEGRPGHAHGRGQGRGHRARVLARLLPKPHVARVRGSSPDSSLWSVASIGRRLRVAVRWTDAAGLPNESSFGRCPRPLERRGRAVGDRDQGRNPQAPEPVRCDR